MSGRCLNIKNFFSSFREGIPIKIPVTRKLKNNNYKENGITKIGISNVASPMFVINLKNLKKKLD